MLIDSSSDITSISEDLAAELHTTVSGTELTLSFVGQARIRTASGQEHIVSTQTVPHTVTMHTAWGVQSEVPFIVFPGERRLIISGQKNSRELLFVDIMTDVRGSVTGRSGDGERSRREYGSTPLDVTKKRVKPGGKRDNPALLVCEKMVVRQAVRLNVGFYQPRDGHDSGNAAENRNESAEKIREQRGNFH